MSNSTYILSILLAAGLAALAGWLLGYLRAQKQLHSLQTSNAELKTTLEMERQLGEQRLAAMESNQEQLKHTFSALSSEALKRNNESFLELAQQNLKQFHIKSQGELEQREKSIEHMIKPVREALDKTEKQLRQIENERKEAYGSLTRHLQEMAQTQQMLQGETRNLVQALRRPEVRGQWGEMTLKRLAELAGMVEHCDFYEQEHTHTEDGGMRPDMIVRMPDGREIVVDVKTPLDAYLNAVAAATDEQRDQELVRHARNVRARVRELASKAYWSQFKSAPDFVVLFIPGDQFLSAALEKEHDLLEYALQQKVILATPTSFVALLRAVAYGWRQEQMAENADRIREAGEELYKRLATFVEHMGKVGKSLGSSLDHYNKAVGSLERQLMPGARKLREMGIESRKTVESLEPLDKSIRSLEIDTTDIEAELPADMESEQDGY